MYRRGSYNVLFSGDPPPIIAYTMPFSRQPKEDSLAMYYKILDHKYKLFGYTLNSGTHYVAILIEKNLRFKYDDLYPAKLHAYEPSNKLVVSSVFLVIEI